MRLFLTYHLTFLLLVTNVGMPVFTHICHAQAKVWSSLFVPAKACCSKQKADGCASICQDIPTNDKLSVGKSPCCEDQKAIIQLEANYVQHLPDAADYHACMAYAHAPSLSLDPAVSFTAIETQSHGPPLSAYGRHLLLSLGIIRC